jgi:ectoine hydroxylase-related dioxygenase (phytanoyl-CoA dioxygenase family)
MSPDTNFIVSFRQRSFGVIPRFLGAAEQAELRRACDAALLQARADSQATAHTSSRISLLGDGRCLDHDLDVLPPIVAFASGRSVCALLRPLALPHETQAPKLKELHYYHEQTKRDWDGDWHRDSQFGRPNPELERELFAATTAVHLRVAFEDDDRLEIVPGSHTRWDTPEELRIRRGSDRATPHMPGAVRVLLRAGDACLFHAWSIHRATYRRAPIRRTLDALYAFTPPARGFSLETR